MENMREVYVVGAAMSKFGRYPVATLEELAADPIEKALADAGMKFKDIEAAYCGSVFAGPYEHRRVIQQFGWNGIMINGVSQACASSSAAFRLAYWSVGLGLYDSALVVGYDKVPKGMLAGVSESEAGHHHLDVMGLDAIPARVALEMKKRMKNYNEPIEAYAKVAAQSSEFASMNEYAHYPVKHSVEEVLAAKMICDPLTLYMCCQNSDGASAVVICSKEKARQLGLNLKRAVEVMAYACGSPNAEDLISGPGGDIGGDFKAGNLTKRLSRELYQKGGITSEEIDVVALHDPFTLAPLVTVEALGLCPEGEAGQWYLDDKFGLNGQVAVNTDGGLLCKGHPLGATGTSQIYEIVKQLRGEAGPRQVPDAKIGMTHNSGTGLLNLHLFRKVSL